MRFGGKIIASNPEHVQTKLEMLRMMSIGTRVQLINESIES
jgi:starvation-inducible outer membrane lipoprotein